ncbi:hypothetical protein [Winogradskya humida]|uniref:Uncharacterized protein n=1 Tax=Winogradskya humida TaxID=113566 RepID=A0ABQ4A774_9ACTN|nr:hypothetical protein [Actinoplanes humidus]GIE26712.1 hypothetical protein Ahu01nite_098140 [Actinoplanes humidus]
MSTNRLFALIISLLIATMIGLISGLIVGVLTNDATAGLMTGGATTVALYGVAIAAVAFLFSGTSGT